MERHGSGSLYFSWQPTLVIRSPSFLLPRRLIRAIGMRRTVILGCFATLIEQLGSYNAIPMMRFVILAGVGLLQACSAAAVTGMVATTGAAVGMAQGELQAAISNLRAVSMTAASHGWAAIFELGRRYQDPGIIYLAGAVATVAALGVAGWVPKGSRSETA